MDRVGDRGHRRHDRHLAYTAAPERMARVRVLDDHGVDHRHVGRDRTAVVEKPGVLEAALLVVDVLLIERPADALGYTALDLALDVGRMDRPADILRGRIVQA